ncbi:MAG TPA: DUF3108 domain-containing protein [Xanthobacteraceae bacterium]|nr:DUF3108 domain-containing protein [Xanthobacteraceae bacterium]
MRSRTAISAATLLFLAATPALAEARLEVRYRASLTPLADIKGIEIGKAAIIVNLTDDGYAAAGSAKVTGLARLVSKGEGSAASRGNFVNGRVSPLTYTSTSETDKKSEEIRISLADNTVTQFAVSPPTPPADDRVPVTEDNRKGVVDPMSAAIISVPGNGDMLAHDSCNRTVSIFDGRQRYDLVFSYERTETAKDVKGYSGPMLVCRVDYRPIAGHRASRLQVKYMEDNKNIFVWLAPVAGTRVLFPIRVSIATLVGVAVVEAETFSATASDQQAASPPAR